MNLCKVREMRIAKNKVNIKTLESYVIRKRSCVVRRGVVGKVPILVTRWLPTLPIGVKSIGMRVNLTVLMSFRDLIIHIPTLWNRISTKLAGL
jgi:hypothetical protein